MRLPAGRIASTIAMSVALIMPVGAAFAADQPVAAPMIDPIGQVAPPIALPPAVSSEATRPAAQSLDDGILSDTRGGQAIVIGNQTLNSSLTGNTVAGNYTAGAVSLSDNAFSNFSGMGNVVINTGAQANLQSAMNLTVNLGH